MASIIRKLSKALFTISNNWGLPVLLYSFFLFFNAFSDLLSGREEHQGFYVFFSGLGLEERVGWILFLRCHLICEGICMRVSILEWFIGMLVSREDNWSGLHPHHGF